MICERFIYGLFTNAGYKTLKTSYVDTLLTKQSFEQLKALRLPSGEQSTFIQMYFPTEDIITFTSLQATNDAYGRKGIINHTVIVKISDFLNEFPEVLGVAFNLIKDQLTLNLSDPPPKSLEPLKVETK